MGIKMDPGKKQASRRNPTFRKILFGLAIIFVVMLVKLAILQFWNPAALKEKIAQHTGNKKQDFTHGHITDRNGVVLAVDSILFDVYAHPKKILKRTPEEIAQLLGNVLNKEPSPLLNQLRSGHNTETLVKGVDKVTAKKIQQLNLYGMIDVVRRTTRKYPQGRLASHILGFITEDETVSSGVERSAKPVLREHSDFSITTDRNGNLTRTETLRPEWLINLPKTNDIQLTIDSRIQFAAEEALKKGLMRTHAPRGAAIVLDPTSGELLAFASMPDFEPEQFYKASFASLKNWAITDVYPPGSTFKILTIACGLETGVITPESKILDTGTLMLNHFKISNYDYSKHGAPGEISLEYLFQHSSNIGSLKVSLMMDPQQHWQLLQGFGFGQKTGIDIPGEARGIFHDAAQWDRTTHATIGYGYGLAATPLQMASAVASIANKGIWMTPHVMQHGTPVISRRTVSEKTAHDLTRILQASIANTPKSTVFLPGYSLAGKTGTSRRPSEKGSGYSNQVFTSFVGFFPAEAPKVLVMVVVDSPNIGEAWGSTVAGPIFKEIAQQIIGFMAIQPTLPASHSLSSKQP
jgi:cell division protein FtsI (penicillin-binding protein 3)